MRRLFFHLRESYLFKKINYYGLIVALFLYSFTVPSFGSRSGLNIIVYGIMGILVFFATTYSVLYQKPTINKWFIPVPAFILFSLIGTILYSHQYRSFLTLVLLGVSFFGLYFTFCIINNRRLILLLVVSGLFLFYCYYIYYYRNSIFNIDAYISGGIRLGSYFDNQNAVSAFAIVGFVLSFYSLLFIRKKYRWLYILPILSTIIVGVSTGSRTFIVAFTVITLVILFFRFRKHLFIYFFLVGVFVVLLAAAFSMPFLATLRDRFIRIFWTFFTDSSRVDTSSIERILWLNYGFFLGNKHLFTGTGPYGFSIMSGVGTYTHSNFSEVWCDFGLPGFVLFYLPLVICVVKSSRIKNKSKSLVYSLFVYYFLVSFSNVFYYFKFYYLILSFMYYLSFGSQKDVSDVHIREIRDYVKKIVITCDGMGSGGAEKVISILANEFVKKGFSVTIIGVSTLYDESFYELDKLVDYVTLHKNTQKKIGFLHRSLLLRRTIRRISPNIIISFLPHVNVYTYYSTIGLGIPLVVSERNDPRVSPKGLFLKMLKNHVFYESQGIVFQTKEAMNYYRKHIKNKSTIIDNPVDNHIIDIKASNNKNSTVLSVGRLTKQKNFKCLIDAFSLFYKKHNSFKLKIYGEGELRDDLEKYAFSKGLSDCFVLCGSDNKWQEKEKDSFAFVLTSDYEGMPNALLEAVCIGIPCIATNCSSGGPRQLIEDGKNGYLVEVGDFYSVYNKLESIYKTGLIYNSYEYCSRFNADSITNEWLCYFKVVLEEFLSR